MDTCPICKKSVAFLKSHLIRDHNFSNLDVKIIFQFAKNNYKPIYKPLREYTFENFVYLLKYSDFIFSDWSFEDVVDSLEMLMSQIAKDYAERCIKELPKMAREWA